ncbi:MULTISPECIES: LysR family transcriptional regulator [unclassified Paenibacillus]|uniref:LysR family transcriptional regulator n=1 Tax=unclassified Paenibacillus TaxID=185978 RepID=UPI001C0F4BA8|nr:MULTISPECIES: LysR family transcriptional regulator [unclassified Paenibacillus]MBU5440901.1 LysR family transcriptional regulator [Paenibacillus sp. MSJ-34]CAH0118397.1 HTH-type transcriptional regulator CynR [Paenibacillus sp. CECT 9249]
MLDIMHEFTVVVEQSSLNKASQVLNISQPALSRKISRLEEDLGVQLFVRKGKRLELTRIGQLTYEFALELRQLQHNYLRTINEYRQEGKSTITIGASLTTLQSTLPDMMNIFMTKHPDVELKAITGKTHEIASLVKEKKVDIGLVASFIDDKTLHCLPLFKDHLCLVLPKHHPLLLGRQPDHPIGMNDFNGLPMILFSKGTWYRILTDELFHRYRIMPDVRMEIDSFEAILRLLATCKLATLLPQSYLRPQLLADNELVVVNFKELEQTQRTTALIYVDPATLSMTARHFIDEAKAFFKK